MLPACRVRPHLWEVASPEFERAALVTRNASERKLLLERAAACAR
jgi:hypothetical protein